ncbi:MAG: chromosomal replication initiator protein DnaA [Pseudomonadota bacterium]
MWENVKVSLKEELGDDVYSSWFGRAQLEEYSNGIVHISVPTPFLKQWIQTNYYTHLRRAWGRESETVYRIDVTVRSAVRKFETSPAKKAKQAARKVDEPAISEPPRNEKDVLKQTNAQGFAGSVLDGRLTFETFVEGAPNALAAAAARQVGAFANKNRIAFNPLYIHASVGHGKTHLLQAIAWAAQDKAVLYLTAEHFMFRFVAALKSQSALAFKERLRGIDLLIIDDLQFLHGPQMQKEFCHTLDALIDGARQVVVAADRPPHELEALNERVRSRLSGGLLVEIGNPDYDLRRGILERRIATVQAACPGFHVPEEVLAFIASNVTANGRDLEGAINRLLAHHQLAETPITMDMAELKLQDLIRSHDQRQVKVEDIQKLVCKQYNVSRQDLLSARRTRSIVWPRQIAMFLCKVMTPRSLPEIGKRFGNRDHTTVLHAVRKVEKLVQDNDAISNEIETLKRDLSE